MMKKWVFLPQNITQNPASNFLPNRLTASVRLRPAQKYLQINPKYFL